MKTHSEKVGRFSFDISYRRFSGDEGLSIKVMGPVESSAKELLRFDCFQNSPHYHVAVYGKNEITAINDADVVGWTLSQLKSSFANMVEAAGGENLNAEEQAQFDSAIDNVSQFSKELVTQERSAT